MSLNMETPILLITFNRPDNTRKVFEKIRQAKIKTLYFFNDAPRAENNDDIVARKEIKKLLKEIDWKCDLKLFFPEKGFGPGFGPANAISWAFEKEDRLIVLEDDCVPYQPFFTFCNHILEKYKDDTRVWLVSGRSHQQGSKFFKEQDYIFSNYGHTWGWATWKRCWDYFDIEMKKWPAFYQNGGFYNVFCSKKEGRIYNQHYVALNKRPINSWDARFGFAVLSNGGLSVVPAKNLIENIGYIGAHSTGKQKVHTLKASDNFKVEKEPLFVLVNKAYEQLHFNTHIKKIMGRASLYKRIINKVLKIIGLR